MGAPALRALRALRAPPPHPRQTSAAGLRWLDDDGAAGGGDRDDVGALADVGGGAGSRPGPIDVQDAVTARHQQLHSGLDRDSLGFLGGGQGGGPSAG